MRILLIILSLLSCSCLLSQKRLVSWGMDDVGNLTKEEFNQAREINPEQWLEINKTTSTWKETFLMINNVYEHSDNKELLLSFANQLTDTTTTLLNNTSRLIIWDRIISGDIIFEGKGLVIENDLFTVAGRANQVLQSALQENFGYVEISTDIETLEKLKEKWIQSINGMEIEQWNEPKRNYENTIEEISNLKAFEAIIVSVQPNIIKDQITSNCLKNIYKLEEMPENPGSEAFCNPDSYSFAYLGMLVGEKSIDKSKDYKYWKDFWDQNKNSLKWNDEKGHFVVENK